MIERIRAALNRRPLRGAAISVAVHAALLMALFWVPPHANPLGKRGDALIVELPNLNEPAMRGAPGAAADAPAVPTPVPPKPAQPTPPAPKAPPAPKVAAAPRVPTPPTPPPAPRPEARELPRTPPQPAPSVDRGDMPTAKSEPQPPAPQEVAKAPPEPERPETAIGPTPASPPPGPVAMVPPAPPDIRSAFRRGPAGAMTGPGGAGGTATGRGGIVGDPIPLDSKDRDLSDYLERIKRLIYQNWAYPCVKDQATRVCEYKSAQLIVEFGILQQGPVQYVQVRRASDWAIYDDYAVNAIKLASPFPPVPPAMMARMQNGSTGAAIVARFTYVIDTGLTNVLR